MTPARMREAERVEVVYYWALNKLSNALVADALELYRSNIPAGIGAASNTSWLAALLRMLFGFRSPAQRLAIAYYRLVRALHTGYTVSLNGETDGDTTTLDALREEFESAVDAIELETEDVAGPPLNLPDSGGLVQEDADIELEEVTDVGALIDRLDDEAEQEAIDQLDQLGIANLTKRLQDVPERDERRDGKVAEVHDIANARQAAAAMRIMQNAARGLVYNLSETDLRIIGWVRYSTSGSPCAFCAMLISRGLVYKTRATAQHQGNKQDEDKYHDNCRCVAVPVFLKSQYESELFDQNRMYDDLWRTFIAGKYGGTDALNKWRWYLKHGFPNGVQVGEGVG